MKFLQVLVFSILVFSCQTKSTAYFDFMAIGDLPYHLPEDFECLQNIITEINAVKPAFTVHIGDIKSGSTPCSDDYFLKIKGYFDQFEAPLLYTPGDNEWTDCHRPAAGEYEPEERLDKLRQLFFSNAQSLGKNPLPLKTQNSFEGWEKFVENAYWEVDNTSFATFHVVGSNNNFKSDSLALNDEFFEREMANLFWLNHLFDQADAKSHQGVIIMLHAALNYRSQEATNGHRSFVNLLRERVSTFKKPVLLLYGDLHRFIIDKPLMNEDGNLLTNFTAAQVFGDRDMHALRIRVNPANPTLFEINQHLVPGN